MRTPFSDALTRRGEFIRSFAPLARRAPDHASRQSSGSSLMTESQTFILAHDRTRLHVIECGASDAPRLVLLHGFLLDHTMWLRVASTLAPTFHVVLPDLRGHGRSDATTTADSIATYAEDLRDVISTVSPASPVVLGGHSMGGIVAMEFVRRHPERVSRLILCGARPNGETEAGRHRWEALIAVARREGPAAATALMESLVFADGCDSAMRSIWFQRMRQNSLAGLIAGARALQDRPDQWEALKAIRAPTLLLFGAEDQATPPDLGGAMAGVMADARLVTIAGAGHTPPLEQPCATAEAIGDFLKATGEV